MLASVRTTEVFDPRPGPLCGWCPYAAVCPEGQTEIRRRVELGVLGDHAPAVAQLIGQLAATRRGARSAARGALDGRPPPTPRQLRYCTPGAATINRRSGPCTWSVIAVGPVLVVAVLVNVIELVDMIVRVGRFHRGRRWFLAHVEHRLGDVGGRLDRRATKDEIHRRGFLGRRLRAGGCVAGHTPSAGPPGRVRVACTTLRKRAELRCGLGRAGARAEHVHRHRLRGGLDHRSAHVHRGSTCCG